MAVSYSKVNSFVEAMAEKAHNLGSDQLVVALTNTAHTSTWTQLSDLTEISYTNCSSRNITTSTSAQTSGTYKLVLTDLVLTASGSVGPFRYIYIYNDTATNDELVGYYDYGSSITLTTSGETFTCDFDGTNGVIQIA
jgi:hypothetical protein